MSTTRSLPIEEVLRQVQLPALPQTAIHLLELSRNSDNGPTEYAKPIEADPGLTGQILRFVNSSFFGFRTEVTSVKLAINLVGVRTIKNFALWSAVFSLLPSFKQGVFNIKLLWQDSLRRALFAKALGKRLGADNEEDLFTAALLQDLAIPILVKELAQEYVQYIDLLQTDTMRLSMREHQSHGWTHADAGAFIAKKWKLPESLCRLIENHTAIDERWGQSKTMVGQLTVSLSALLPSSAFDRWHDQGEFLRVFAQQPASRGSLDELFTQVDRDMEQFAPLLKLTTPSRTLASYLVE
ncbi:MAG: HDOD domain-containing protein [Planctomycetales bacterium]|nr:HDOD domain-containing protein [Planctomycetales bacterium]